MTPEDMMDPTAVPTEEEAEGAVESGKIVVSDMKALGAAIAEGIASGTRRKKTYGEYIGLSAQQPNKYRAERLTKVCFQNGAWMDPSRLTNDEIKGLNAIHRSGRYIDRLVEVIINEGSDPASMDIRYNCKSTDQRMEFKSHVKNLLDLLQQVVGEQVTLDEQDEERLTRPSQDTRPSGDTAKRVTAAPVPRTMFASKATQEARAKAEAK